MRLSSVCSSYPRNARRIGFVAGVRLFAVATTVLCGCSPAGDDAITKQSAVTATSPVLTVSAGTTSFVAPSAAVAVDPALTLTYVDGPNLTGVRVAITTGYVSSQDTLAVANQNGITGNFAAGTGILTLTGSATAAVYETALRSVTYANSGGAMPDVSARQISFSIGSNSLYFTETGHYYEIVTSAGITWTNAKPAAAARTFFGLQGYLVTVTSAAENSFVASKLAGQGWIGASDAASEGTWRWTTGPEGLEASGLGRYFFAQTLGNCGGIGGACGAAVTGSFYAWSRGEPNNSGGENYAHFLSNGLWNDYPNSVGSSIQGYVAEYGGMPGDPVVQISGTKNLSVAAGCVLDSQCPAGKYCEASTKVCKAKLEAGVAISNDGLHDGTCTASNASAVCTASACNVQSDTCASTNGAGCTAAAMCVSNVCGTNGFCGAANGATGCTPATASAYCQSGACSSSGVCIPAVAGSCYVDLDCNPDFFCRRDLFACKPVLNAGVDIPDDGLHGGMCSSAVAAAVCSTGACNMATGTCAGVLGAMCSSPADCSGNLCGTNGHCGYADGSGICSSATAASVCQSGACSAGFVCIPMGAGRCWIDADCAGAEYCERPTALCKAKLPASAAIPDDTLHDGTCLGAAAVCASGLCNGNTNTCAGVNGSDCADGAGCVGNTCGSNGRCGIAVGNGPCDVTVAADVCQSGVCSVSGVCQPAGSGGCWVDADCAAGRYCDADSLTCHDQLAAGTAFPVDRLHDGVCSSGLASTICANGSCNAVTNTCGGPAGMACTSAAFCVVNVCNGAGQCGFGPGEGDCQSSNAATRCASGVCSTAGVCLSAAVGNCWADADCAANSFCARLTATCQVKLAPNTALPTDAIHDGHCTTPLAPAVCATGACNATTQTCSSAIGATCAGPGGCTNNICGSNGQCGLTAGTGPCNAQNALEICQSGVCGPESGVCVPSTPGGCGTDADCSASQYCGGNALTCVMRVATGGVLPVDGTHVACVNGRNTACGTGLCNATTSTCAAANGTTCTEAKTCVTNLCGRNGKCGLDDGQPGCTTANAGFCQTGVCTAAGICGALGCATDAECPVASAFCDASVGLCKAKLILGQGLPVDPLHDGQCNSSLAGAVCATGSCNAVTSACALANGVACQVNGECAMNACGSDALCGLADGQAGCTTATATVCRSGLCSAKGNRCVPIGAGRCAVDADCVGSTFCAPATLSCVPRLANGVSIPMDGLHDDGCLPGNGMAVCASGLCNPVTATCAGATSAPCTMAAECTNGVCGANGGCGQVPGKGPCDATTAESLCQSGVCNVKLGLCKSTAVGSCLEDTDCATDSFCVPTTLTCAKKLDVGVAIPSDGPHSGVCDKATAAAVCASAACNAQTNTCAVSNGQSCSAGAACVSGVCSTDSLCGAATGATCARANDCRSGICTAGVCVSGTTKATSAGGGGCDCQVGSPDGGGTLWLLALAAAGHVARRRRRATRGAGR